MRALILLPATLLPAPALAHLGHVAEAAGHDHWIALGALGVAVGVAVWGALKGKDEDAADAEETEEAEADAAEQPA